MFPFRELGPYGSHEHVSVATADVPSAYDQEGSLADVLLGIPEGEEPFPASLSLSYHRGDTESEQSGQHSAHGGRELAESPPASAQHENPAHDAQRVEAQHTSDSEQGVHSVAHNSVVESASQALLEALRDGVQQSLAPLAGCMRQLAEVSTQLARAQLRRPQNVSTLRISDIKLKEFAGHKYPNAQHIDNAYFLPLLQWLQDCKTRLASSSFAESDKVAALVSALTGGARAAFNALYANASVHEWSLDDTFDKLAALVPEHKVQFTRAALAMQFRRDCLIDDIKTFALYVQYGGVCAVGNHYVWTELQSKMASACPGLFAIAANEFNLHFAWTEDKPFNEHVNQALNIVSTLQSAGRIAEAAERATGGKQPDTRDKRGTKRGAPQPPNTEKGSKRSKREQDQAGNRPNEQQRAQARALSLCFNCGTKMDRKTFAAHKAECKEYKPGLFKQNLAKAQKEQTVAPGAERTAQ